ncbi:hypothetical protein O9992_00130 [Vibrio lentus]|nr:hypothetical protein [Vibrio lentus]
MGEEDPLKFVRETQSQAMNWFESPSDDPDDDNGIERWFPDGVMNTCWLALDYPLRKWIRADKWH